jgi:hypothetical protein
MGVIWIRFWNVDGIFALHTRFLGSLRVRFIN